MKSNWKQLGNWKSSITAIALLFTGLMVGCQQAPQPVFDQGSQTPAADVREITAPIVVEPEVAINPDAPVYGSSVTSNLSGGGGGGDLTQAAADDRYSPLHSARVDYSGTARDFALTDDARFVYTTSSSAVTLTVPAQASVTWEDGTDIMVEQGGAGIVTLAAAGGVTLTAPGGLVTSGLGTRLSLYRTGTNAWTVGTPGKAGITAGRVGYVFDGLGSVVTSPTTSPQFIVDRGGTITKVRMWGSTLAGTAATGSAVVDVWKCAHSTSAVPLVADTLINTGAGGTKPTITSATNFVVTIDGSSHYNTRTVTAGDQFVFKLESCSTFTYLAVVVEYE